MTYSRSSRLVLSVLSIVVSVASGFSASVPKLSDTITPLPGSNCFAPLPIAINNTTKRVYVVGGGQTFGSAGRVSVIDAQSDSVVAGLTVPWQVDAIAINEATNRIYLATYSGPDGAHLVPQTVVVDGSTNQITGTFNAALGTTVAVDPATGRLFGINYNDATVRVFDGATLANLATITLQSGNDFIRALRMTINPTSRKLYLTNSDSSNPGVIGVVDLDQLSTRPFLHTNSNGNGNIVADPTLELHNGNGDIIATDDNWRDTQAVEITASGLQPKNDLEPAIKATLTPGNFTAIARGKSDTTGVAVVEAYTLP